MTGTARQKQMLRDWTTSALVFGLLTTRALPAAASFGLDSTSSGRIWISNLLVDSADLPPIDRDVALLDFGNCPDDASIATLEPRERDCHFEQQLVTAITRSATFHRVSVVQAPNDGTDLVLIPRRSRIQFRREVIPAAKPFLVLSLFTYLWTPLPYERDTETYELSIAIVDREGTERANVILNREYTHSLGTYATERTLPADLINALKEYERPAGDAATCNGPHGGVVVHELLRALREAVLRTGSTPNVL